MKEPFQSSDYGTVVGAALRGAQRNPLGPGTADASIRPRLAAITPESIVAPRTLVDRDMALCCLAALWLRFDFLDESHRVSQEIANTSGSYWHGIMHRREPDFENAKYWFRRVGDHPICAALGRVAQELARQAKAGKAADRIAADAEWDPFRFVDLCRAAGDDDLPLAALCMDIQQREWELLFVHCYRRAISQS